MGHVTVGDTRRSVSELGKFQGLGLRVHISGSLTSVGGAGTV